MEIDFSKIKTIPSDTEIPVHNNCVQTQRSLCANSPQNTIILDKLEALFNPLNVQECESDLFENGYETFESIEQLKGALSELLIRFDTCPGNYTKEDYNYLMMILYKSLLYFYDKNKGLYAPTVSVNDQPIEAINNNSNIEIGTNDPDHLEVTTTNGAVNIKANVGEMETPSTKLATVNDIRNYIENKLSWKIYG